MEGMEGTGAVLHRHVAGHGQVLVEHELDLRVLLAVPADQRPDFSDCRGFTAAHPTDERNRLYLLVNSAGTRLYVVECFF